MAEGKIQIDQEEVDFQSNHENTGNESDILDKPNLDAILQNDANDNLEGIKAEARAAHGMPTLENVSSTEQIAEEMKKMNELLGLFKDIVNVQRENSPEVFSKIVRKLDVLESNGDLIDHVAEYAWQPVLSNLESLAVSKNKYVSSVGTKLISERLDFFRDRAGDREWTEMVEHVVFESKDFFNRRLVEKSREVLKERRGQDDPNLRDFVTLSLSRIVALYGTDEEFRDENDFICNNMNSNQESPYYEEDNFCRSFSGLITSEDQAISGRSREMLGNLYGVKDIDRMIKNWEISTSSANVISRIETNITRMQDLNNHHSGSVGTLFDEFGIADFGRYGTEMLSAQYENRDNQDLPYGVVLFPRSDHNGAFYQNAIKLNDFHHQLEGNYNLRVYECGSQIEAAKALIRSRDRYGEKHKISFGILGGHGSPDSVQFGNKSKKKYGLKAFLGDLMFKPTVGPKIDLTSEDVAKPTMPKIGELFEDDSTVILVSCSTGVEEGIGEKLSSALGVKVIAPTGDTNLKNITVKYDKSGKPDFDVTYTNNTSTAIFKAEDEDPLDLN